MGICPSKPKTHRVQKENNKSPAKERTVESPEEKDDADNGWSEEDLTSHMGEMLTQIQEYHLHQIKEELNNDMESFVLNNLLMCMQFFENFERAKDDAEKLKRRKEREINSQLAECSAEGAILGERRCILLHGMGEVLAKNYIYRSPDTSEENYYGNYYYGSDPKNTFMSEGILPMEFISTWDNLELYRDVDSGQMDAGYSSAKGSAKTLHFAMEEPNSTNTSVPPGYVRLRSLDLNSLDTTVAEDNPDYDYATFPDDNVPEARSESDELSSDSEDPDNHEHNDTRYSIRTNSSANGNLEIIVSHQNSLDKGGIGLQKEIARKTISDKLKTRRPTGGALNLPRYERTQSKTSVPSLAASDSNIPKVEVSESGAQTSVNNLPTNFQDFFNTRNISNSTSKLMPPPSHQLRPKVHSAAAAVGGQDSGMYSRSSSMMSEDIRKKFQRHELKNLVEFPEKNRFRANIDIEKQEPVDLQCYHAVNRESVSDSEEESSSSDESDSDSSKEGKPHKEPKIEKRLYLKSNAFSGEFCSEFFHTGKKYGLNSLEISNAVVLGTTIRCAKTYISEFYKDEEFSITHAYTPALHSKLWPSRYYLHFNHAMLVNSKESSSYKWPTKTQVENIEKLGCYAIPLGFRSVEVFNTQQLLEWQLNFINAENILLNSFKHAHWRAYIFTSLLFRAFLAPLGPQGVGIEHIRNILYFMCQEDFVNWNEEHTGLHLRVIISKLFECLGKRHMPNFFMQSQNMLKGIPRQSVTLVQHHVNHIRDNLIVYCIYALRNLTCIQPGEKFYPMPNFKKLYKFLVVSDTELLGVRNPGLFEPHSEVEDTNRARPRKKKKKKKVDSAIIQYGDAIEEDFDGLLPKPKEEHDRTWRKAHKKYLKLQKDKEAKPSKAPGAKIPVAEKRKSIDLKKQPIVNEQFSQLRKELIIEFFIKHFLTMAAKCNEFRAYSQSAMYIMHVENLCQILKGYKERKYIDMSDLDDFMSQCDYLRQVVGSEMKQYILVKFSHLIDLTLPGKKLVRELSRENSYSQDNWGFRKLPTPPGPSDQDDKVKAVTVENSTRPPPVLKKLETPNLMASLRTLGTEPTPDVSKSPRRTESIKFIDQPVRKLASRPSIKLAENEFECTEL